jgi:hypothetical protein
LFETASRATIFLMPARHPVLAFLISDEAEYLSPVKPSTSTAAWVYR